jgi:anaerobic magnesium-protoporphyrin IX monomethyl ester cyclase
MTKVLFANAYFYKLDPKQWRFKQPYPPLGTILAAAVVRGLNQNSDEGKGVKSLSPGEDPIAIGFRVRPKFEVSLFDTNLRENPDEIIPVLKKETPRYVVIYDDGFNYLTKMCLTVMREAAFTMAREAKKSGSIVIVSSSDAADHYEKYFLQGVDYVVRGEGEETLKELLLKLEDGEDASTIFGIACKKNDQVVVTPARTVLRDLDKLPIPAWDLVNVESYRSIWLKQYGYFSLNLATTRGCPYKCNWCAKPIYGNRYNSRSPEHVVKEIELLLKEYKPDHFWMSDDIFGLKPGWVESFRNEVKKKSLSFKYKIQSRVDLLLEENIVDALADSGAQTIWVGAESGSQKILDAMDKGTTVDQIKKARLLLKKKKINVGFFLQFGYLGETQKDIEATLKMVLDLMPEEIGISVSYPLPGTVFYEKVKSMLKEKQNWSDSDDLAMMYKGTFNSAYYKKLHRYIHNRYRIQRGLNQLKQWSNNPAISLSGIKKVGSMILHLPISYIHKNQLKKIARTTVN